MDAEERARREAVRRAMAGERARIMAETVRAHLAAGSKIERVTFVLRGDDAYRPFEESWGSERRSREQGHQSSCIAFTRSIA